MTQALSLLVVIVSSVVIAAAIAGSVVLAWQAWKARQVLLARRRVVVNLTTGKAVEGVLVRTEGPLLFVRDARLHEGQATVPMDGEVVVERDKVDFIQAF